MSKIINVGRVTAYAEAVAGGYQGTREEWERDLANLGTTAAEVEANRQAVAEDKAAVENDLTTVGEYKDAASAAASEAAQSAADAHTDALAATAAKEAAQEAQGLAAEARADAVSAKGAAENAQAEADQSAEAAAGSALVAGNAAETATANAGAASDSATAAAASAASVSGVVAEITTAKTEALTAIEAKGAETLDSIPDDYTELSGDVDDLENAVPKKAAAVYRTTPGSYDTVRITDGALDAPVRSALVTLPYNAEGYTGVTLTQKTANIFGGIDMANGIKAAITNAVIDTDAKTVRFSAPSASNKILFSDFKPSTQYTMLLTFAKNNTAESSNTRIRYTDNTTNSVTKPIGIVNEFSTGRFVTNANKSVQQWEGLNNAGNTTIKYDESGIFEGVVGLDEFTPPKNAVYTADWTDAAPGFYGGTYDFVTGELVQLYTDTGAETIHRYALPAHDVETGIGVNTFTVSSGTLKLDYQADTKKYVDNSASETKPVKATVLGYTATEDTYRALGADTAFADQITGAMTAWMTDYAGDAKKIPFVLHTDQHAMLTTGRKWIFDLIDYCANWDQISAVFNLGDTVLDHWTDSTVTSDPLMRNQELENALLTVASIPKDKQINVWGNHDTWYTASGSSSNVVIPNLKYINPYFKTVGLRTVRYADNSGNMVIYDDQYHVRYLVVGGWDYNDRDSGSKSHLYFFINSEHWKWIIDELSTDCGYDIVIVSHVPLIWHSDVCYNPITGASAASDPSYIAYGKAYSAALFGARKSKTAGEITVNSEVIPYDFSGCKDKILCALAGHTHVDLVDRAGGLLVTAFDRFSQATPVVHFGLIDREANRLNVWKVSGGENPKTDNWRAPFDTE